MESTVYGGRISDVLATILNFYTDCISTCLHFICIQSRKG
jgi:hypothetical protein